MTFTEYLPKVRIGYQDKEVSVDLWIAPNSENEDISLSKSVMHQLGFQLVSADGTKVWDMKGNPVLEVEVPPEESEEKPWSTNESSLEEENLPEDANGNGVAEVRERVSIGRPQKHFAKWVSVTKWCKIPGHYASLIPLGVHDERIKKGQTYVFEPNEALASDLEFDITSSVTKAENDGVLIVPT